MFCFFIRLLLLPYFSLAAMTASLALYRILNLPQPWTPTSTSIPLLIYGGSSAVGAFAIKLASWSNIHPIIAVAGKGCAYVDTLVDTSKGDLVLDYRSGKTNVIKAVRHRAGSSDLLNAIDAISNEESIQTVLETMDDGGKVAVTLPQEEQPLREGVEVSLVMSGDVHNTMGKKAGAEDFGHIFMTAFSRGCSTGSFCGHPFKIVDGGIHGIQSALEALKSGNNSAVKYVVRIGDTK
jgi:NADPH2:quinone reductase